MDRMRREQQNDMADADPLVMAIPIPITFLMSVCSDRQAYSTKTKAQSKVQINLKSLIPRTLTHTNEFVYKEDGGGDIKKGQIENVLPIAFKERCQGFPFPTHFVGPPHIWSLPATRFSNAEFARLWRYHCGECLLPSWHNCELFQHVVMVGDGLVEKVQLGAFEVKANGGKVTVVQEQHHGLKVIVVQPLQPIFWL